MLYNYFKVALRNLSRKKGYSFINIGGLAIGMAMAMLVGLWVYDELTFDTYHENYGTLVQVMQHQTLNGIRSTGAEIPRPLEFVLRNKYSSDFKYLSMCTWTGENILSTGDRSISKSGNFFQKDFPEMLSLKMIKGTRNGLNDPTSIMLSESTAKALFGTEDPLNKSISIANNFDVKVTGVYEDLPYSTSFKNLDFMASWELLNTTEWNKKAIDQWGTNLFHLYAQLNPTADVHAVSEKIKNIKADQAKDQRQFEPEIFLHPMSDWHLQSEWKDGINVGGRIQSVWLFGIIGVFVLLLACINFMNLSTARSEKRAKEVGIRMTIGSVRSQLISQFLIESFCVVIIAFMLAVMIVILLLPMFNDLAGKRIIINWTNPFFWLASVAFIFITSLVAGSYPAFYLSSFRPVSVLKGVFKTDRFATAPRKVLVVIQFTVSVTLIIGTVIVYKQIQFSKERPVGYDQNGLVMIQMKSQDFFGKFDVLRNELKNSGAVTEMSESSSPVSDLWHTNSGFEWPGKNPDLQTDFAVIRVTHEYGKTVNWKLNAGRDFSREFSTDSTAIILNETAAKFINTKDPVDLEITWNNNELWGSNKKLHVIGVVDDIIMQSPYAPVKQTIYLINYKNVGWINLKLNPEKSVNESLATIESVFKNNIPSAPFEYKFADAEYAKKFAAEERIGKLASVFAVLAILISCLGLFGLASFVAEQRTKEIGIRKVLGASVASLCKMLSKDFIVLVMISCLIAAPVAHYFLSHWLNNFEYHTEISWWVFILAGAGALGITLFTVSYQAIKAALMNPVNSLKSE
ncbi:MAG TPA: ABC transporter permease [Cyclobacteriaceae bacterium]|nr:ABC transporter permease [Cyclobacteriaceae bacterium]